MPFVFGAKGSSSVGQPYSLRFNEGSSDYLNRTPASATNRTTWTLSYWAKKINISSTNSTFYAGDGTTANDLRIRFNANDGISIFTDIASVQTVFRSTTAVYRDASAWYHIVVAFDTTQATANDRIKLYVNGVQITSFATLNNPAQNATSYVNNNNPHYIGYDVSGYYNGYLSEIYLIDGQALTPSSFGQTDTASGIWKPKAYTGTYGTNGFYLKFSNSASLGTDSSGNGNNFTVNNLTSVDQSIDTPYNNFAIYNPVLTAASSTAAFAEGNLQVSTRTTTFFGGASTIGVSKGKWYWEGRITVQASAVGMFGIDGNPAESARLENYPGEDSWSYGYYSSNGNKFNGATSTAYGNSYTTNDIIMIAMDLDNNYLYFGKNGTWQNSGVPTSGATGTGAAFSISSSPPSGFYFITCGDQSATVLATFQGNFGSPVYSANSFADAAGYGNFSYAVPSGYYSLCTANLNTYG
jgi:3D (Asp-Asp-Asp) domain-containing protein